MFDFKTNKTKIHKRVKGRLIKIIEIKTFNFSDILLVQSVDLLQLNCCAKAVKVSIISIRIEISHHRWLSDDWNKLLLRRNLYLVYWRYLLSIVEKVSWVCSCGDAGWWKSALNVCAWNGDKELLPHNARILSFVNLPFSPPFSNDFWLKKSSSSCFKDISLPFLALMLWFCFWAGAFSSEK